MKFSIKDLFSKCDQTSGNFTFHIDFISTSQSTFTEEILNGKLHFLCSVNGLKLSCPKLGGRE